MIGYDVYCFDVNLDMLVGVVVGCDKFVVLVVKKFKIDDLDFVFKVVQKIIIYDSKGVFIDVVKDCDVFLEVIFEDLKLKCKVLVDFLL